MRELPILFSTPMVRAILEGRKTMTRRVIKPQPDHRHRDIAFEYGKLYEYSQISGVWHVQRQHKCPYGQPGDRLWVRETWAEHETADGGIIFKARCPKKLAATKKWKPSIFMPKAGARIWLEVVDVRVERLQEIMDYAPGPNNPIVKEGLKYGCDFIALWENLNKKRGYGWDTNPWVWVVEFKRIEEVRS